MTIRFFLLLALLFTVQTANADLLRNLAKPDKGGGGGGKPGGGGGGGDGGDGGTGGTCAADTAKYNSAPDGCCDGLICNGNGGGARCGPSPDPTSAPVPEPTSAPVPSPTCDPNAPLDLCSRTSSNYHWLCLKGGGDCFGNYQNCDELLCNSCTGSVVGCSDGYTLEGSTSCFNYYDCKPE